MNLITFLKLFRYQAMMVTLAYRNNGENKYIEVSNTISNVLTSIEYREHLDKKVDAFIINPEIDGITVMIADYHYDREPEQISLFLFVNTLYCRPGYTVYLYENYGNNFFSSYDAYNFLPPYSTFKHIVETVWINSESGKIHVSIRCKPKQEQ